ncbi:hypothetical protein TRIUR3_30816 [Triticum urartu]|uniref:Uncharacterized protein n=1 Tax=Triticum urartu TaxID=4572 RepID=M7YXR4_TRIUA|nr:hypothetical protein TRIUR3_30816 [Triticum urartu]
MYLCPTAGWLLDSFHLPIKEMRRIGHVAAIALPLLEKLSVFCLNAGNICPWCWSSEGRAGGMVELLFQADAKDMRGKKHDGVHYASLQDFAAKPTSFSFYGPSSSTIYKCHIYLSQAIFVKDHDM